MREQSAGDDPSEPSTMNDPESDENEREFRRFLAEDAAEVARRTLRSKFGRLSNARIIRVLRNAAIDKPAIARVSDEELLGRWFDAFATARERLRKPN